MGMVMAFWAIIMRFLWYLKIYLHYLAFKRHTSCHDLLILRLFQCLSLTNFYFIFLLSSKGEFAHPSFENIYRCWFWWWNFQCLFDCCPSSQHVDDDLFVLFCLWFAFRRKNSIKNFTFYYHRDSERESEAKSPLHNNNNNIPFYSTHARVRDGEEKQKKSVFADRKINNENCTPTWCAGYVLPSSRVSLFLLSLDFAYISILVQLLMLLSLSLLLWTVMKEK